MEGCIATHSPYVFGPDGEFARHGEEFTYNYQIAYVNKQILEVVAGIIENSERQPIIILQVDHGLRHIPEERVAILNTYYFPNGGDQNLYPWVTPVNTFRLILDYYFSSEFGLLEDISYF